MESGWTMSEVESVDSEAGAGYEAAKYSISYGDSGIGDTKRGRAVMEVCGCAPYNIAYKIDLCIWRQVRILPHGEDLVLKMEVCA